MDKLFLRKAAIIITGCLVYAIGFYHRNCTGALLEHMADSLNVTKSKLGVLSSMYFWSYALEQPFVGSISDLINPKYIISGSLLLSSLASLMCGISRSYYLTCFARLLVGFGCGCMYVPVCRTIAQWFTVRQFAYAQSTVVAFGGLGGLLAQFPLAGVTSSNWQIPFYIGSAISLILGVLSFFLMQGSPHQVTESPSFKESMAKLVQNLKMSLTYRDFWLLAFWKFLTPATYQSVAATWGVSYLENGLGMTHKEAAYYISIVSVAWTAGAPFLAVISNWVHTRKWCLVVCTAVATASTTAFTLIGTTPHIAVTITLLFVFALTSGASLTISAVTFKEMLSKELVGTLMGCGNLVMLGTSVQQDITSAVIARYENGDDSPPLVAYRYGLWLTSAVSCGISLVLTFFIRDTYKKATEAENTDKEDDSITTNLVQEENTVI